MFLYMLMMCLWGVFFLTLMFSFQDDPQVIDAMGTSSFPVIFMLLILLWPLTVGFIIFKSIQRGDM